MTRHKYTQKQFSVLKMFLVITLIHFAGQNIYGQSSWTQTLPTTIGDNKSNKMPPILSNQTITWNQTLSASYGDPPIRLNATASSNLPVTYTSSNENVAIVTKGSGWVTVVDQHGQEALIWLEGTYLTIVGSGAAVITAKQEGNAQYNPASEVTKTITVNIKQYAIIASASSNGSISPSGTISVNQGENKIFTFTPNTGYEIDQVLVDGINNTTAVSNGSYTFSNVTANHTISVSFKQKAVSTYTITASSGSGGSISPSGTVSVTSGGSQTFTFSPNSCYEITQVLIDGTANATAKVNGSYTFSNVTANHTISVSFTQKSYSITASTGSNGSISPSGTANVNCGDSKTYTITPNSGYNINQVLVDGSNVGGVSSYTFSNVTANHTISVSFTPQPTYTITPSVSTGGSISPNYPVSVTSGGSQTFTFSPNSCYEINQVLIDGIANATAKSNASYSFSNVTTDHTIYVSFTQKSYSIVASTGGNGSISPSGTANINCGDSKTYTITPNSGYQISQVLVDDSNVGGVSSYTFSNVTANHSIQATFTAIKTLSVSPASYNFGATGGTSSTISITSNQSWTISDDATWLSTSKTRGSNNNTFIITADANTSTSFRNATVTVSGGGLTQTISVMQDPASSLTVSTYSYNFTASGSTSSIITITSNVLWTVSDDAPWLTTSKTSGSGSNTFTMTANENTSTSLRNAKVTVAGGEITRVINVTQDGVSNCSVGPLLTTKWNQRAPYNNLVKSKLGDYPTGCSATAMAQVMKFWNTPKTRTKAIPGYTANEGDVQFEFDVPAIDYPTTYDWANMTNTYNSSSTQLQNNAVATLMYECGVSIEMDYTPGGSGAWVGTSALPTYFGYEVPIWEERDNDKYKNNPDSWNDMLRKELDEGRPVIYVGWTTDNLSDRNLSGHAFVCDGYDYCSYGQQFFHFNFGWGGSADDYYVTTALDPKSHGYEYMQSVIRNIKPSESSQFFPAKPGGEEVFTISSTKSNGGILIPSGTEYVYPNENKMYSFTPYDNYVIDEVNIDGVANTTAKANGYYTFENITENHTISVTFKSKSGTGIEDVHSQSISIYPNPATNDLFIKSELPIKKVEIYSLAGTLMKSENNFNERISVSSLYKGVYLLKIYIDKGLVVSKIVKK